jgi:chromosomal replication initiation ATPase DnaA
MDVAPAARSAPGSLRRAPPKSQGKNGADAQLWQEALSELALQMTQSTFDAWLRRSHFVSRQEQTWTIAVDSPAAQSWLQNRLSTIIERTLSGIVGQGTSVRFVVDSGEGMAA